MKSLLLLSIFFFGLCAGAAPVSGAVTQSIGKPGYCLAIRGNGNAAPAHWGAISRLVSERGMPIAMAGGSSASINMFLLESLSLNPIPQSDEERALMIKSFQGYLEVLAQTKEGCRRRR